MMLEPAIWAEHHIGSDHTIRSDECSRANFGSRINNRTRVNFSVAHLLQPLTTRLRCAPARQAILSPLCKGRGGTAFRCCLVAFDIVSVGYPLAIRSESGGAPSHSKTQACNACWHAHQLVACNQRRLALCKGEGRVRVCSVHLSKNVNISSASETIASFTTQ